MIGENPIIVVDLKEKSMDIRIGFVDSGRELAITGVERVSGVSVSQQSEAVALIVKADRVC